MKKSVVQRNASITTTTLNRKITTMKKTILTLLGVAAIGCALFSQQAYADSISFAGGSASATGDSSLSSPTTVSFSSGWSVFAGNGIFAGTTGSATTMTSYSFTGDGAAAACTTCPETQWSFVSGGNTYSFTLTSLTNAATRAGSIAASGVGYVQVNGGSHISGTWSMNGSGSGFNYGANFTFVSTTVPDGGSAVALLGVGLTAVEGVRRFLRRRSA
jgi:VPDSG-CTERM motif